MSGKDIQAFCSRVKERMQRPADEAQGFYRTAEEFLAMIDVWHEMMQDGTLTLTEEHKKDPIISAIMKSAQDESVERIVAAAVQIEGVTISLPRPGRHGTILACTSYSLNMEPGRELQGFLTSTGRFVNRIQARHIADIAGQKPGRSGGRDNPELFSEDLW